MKIKRNEECPCGSGLKYKKCHYIKDQTPLPLAEIDAISRKLMNYKDCLHPFDNSKCGSKIINAHSIQKSGPLKCVVNNGHVCAFRFDEDNTLKLDEIGWKKASTFRGFCEKHDTELFLPIEQEQFVGSGLQCFLASYRSFSHEYITLRNDLLLADGGLIGINKYRGEDNLPIEKQLIKNHKLSTMHAVKNISYIMKKHVVCYREKSFNDFNHAIFYFYGDPDVVVSSVITPLHKMNGEEIQNLTLNFNFDDYFDFILGRNTKSSIVPQENKVFEYISINTLITEDGHAIVLSWLKDFEKCTKYVESIISLDHNIIPSRMISIIFSNASNAYFSKDWFYSLDQEKQNYIKSLSYRLYSHEPINFIDHEYLNFKLKMIDFF